MDQAPERALDEYLVLLSQSGSSDALDGLARRWTPRLLRYSARVLGGSSDAADTARDVVQEVWIGVIRGLRGLRDPAQFPAWIYGITTRKCADVIRADMRGRAPKTHVVDQEPAQDASLALLHQIDLADAIRRLPPLHRAVIHLFYREDLTVAEIATVLRVPAGTVKSRLHHARESLRQQLDGCGRNVASHYSNGSTP